MLSPCFVFLLKLFFDICNLRLQWVFVDFWLKSTFFKLIFKLFLFLFFSPHFLLFLLMFHPFIQINLSKSSLRIRPFQFLLLWELILLTWERRMFSRYPGEQKRFEMAIHWLALNGRKNSLSIIKDHSVSLLINVDSFEVSFND